LQIFRCYIVECSQCNIELAVLVDASQKSSTGWQDVKNFVSSFVANFNINSNCVTVVLMPYANAAGSPVTYSDINSLQNGVRSLNLIGGSSNVAVAFQSLRNNVFPRTVRPGARRVVAIITDELSCTSAVTTEAANIRNMGVVILGVGVRTFTMDSSCLRQIVTPNQAIEVPAHNQLGSYVSRAVQFACVSQPAPAPAPAPSKYIVHEIYGKPFNSFCYDDL